MTDGVRAHFACVRACVHALVTHSWRHARRGGGGVPAGHDCVYLLPPLRRARKCYERCARAQLCTEIEKHACERAPADGNNSCSSGMILPLDYNVVVRVRVMSANGERHIFLNNAFRTLYGSSSAALPYTQKRKHAHTQ